ncbi:50S ribosomal protein L6 [bacterium]|nr:50S ribosomal protein L6 [bacterium]
MSKIGRRPIDLTDLQVEFKDRVLAIKGPKGDLTLDVPAEIEVEIDTKENELRVIRKSNSRQAKALHGTIRALINNMVKGVKEGFKKELVFEGVGYKAEVKGDKLILDVGYSHDVEFPIPEGIQISVDKNKITVEGIDKQKVGQIAYKIRDIRSPDSYKGQGIRYADEVLSLKPGKATAKGTEE